MHSEYATIQGKFQEYAEVSSNTLFHLLSVENRQIFSVKFDTSRMSRKQFNELNNLFLRLVKQAVHDSISTLNFIQRIVFRISKVI